MAKVTSVNLKRTKISVENITQAKRDGTKANVFIHASNVQIVSLNTDDGRRVKKIEQEKSGKEVKKENASNKK